MGALPNAESMEETSQHGRVGDPSGFTELYRRLGRSLFGTALRMLGRPQDAEDAVQETFLKYYRKDPDVPPERVEAWLRRVLTNDCLDRLRQRGRRGETELVEASAAGSAGSSGLAVDLQRAVSRLPRKAREVFLLHDVEGFKHAQVADLLGVSVGASKSQLFRARGILRGFMNETPGGVR
jgi:RNA polymerase sigma-70 factor (ECF subfamily)